MMLSLEVRRVRCGESNHDHMPSALPSSAHSAHFAVDMPRRYLIKLYYKTRLAKIEKLAASILDDEELASRLSECVT